MSDPDRASPPAPADFRGQYREAAGVAIAGLAARLATKIQRDGPLRFSEFMAAALYDPAGGYYAASADQVGRGGDFFTSVSAGPLFGRLLASHLVAAWQDIGAPPAWRIIELGAHDGSLALDVLTEIAARHPAAFAALEYFILEPLDRLATAQRTRLAAFATRLRISADPTTLPPRPGFLIANEVLDALPFEVVESTGTGWNHLGVTLTPDGRFAWSTLGPASCPELPRRPAGYRTEIRPALRDFLAPLVPLVSPGRMLWIDYGFERADLYADSRTRGTLRTFRRHQAGEDPLENPGGQDITAHVDFTALRGALESLGGRVLGFEDQARFLTRLATPWLHSLEGRADPETAKAVRNFQTLTHPAQLGARFHIMEATWSRQ